MNEWILSKTQEDNECESTVQMDSILLFISKWNLPQQGLHQWDLETINSKTKIFTIQKNSMNPTGYFRIWQSPVFRRSSLVIFPGLISSTLIKWTSDEQLASWYVWVKGAWVFHSLCGILQTYQIGFLFATAKIKLGMKVIWFNENKKLNSK